MTTTAIGNTLQELVQHELAWDPSIGSGTIGVSVQRGVATLTGFVRSYAEKIAAERAALRVMGTEAVANDLVVRPGRERIDPEIAGEAAEALRIDMRVPTSVKAVVENGYVTLEGTCAWHFEREASEHAVEHLAGVRGVTNHLALAPCVSAEVVKSQIEQALARSAEIDSHLVTVSTHGNAVVLGGSVRSHAQRVAAGRAAWAAPGIMSVENDIVVRA